MFMVQLSICQFWLCAPPRSTPNFEEHQHNNRKKQRQAARALTLLTITDDFEYKAIEKIEQGKLCIPFKGKLAYAASSVFKLDVSEGLALEGWHVARAHPSAWKMPQPHEVGKHNMEIVWKDVPLVFAIDPALVDVVGLKSFKAPCLTNTYDIEPGTQLTMKDAFHNTQDAFIKQPGKGTAAKKTATCKIAAKAAADEKTLEGTSASVEDPAPLVQAESSTPTPTPNSGPTAAAKPSGRKRTGSTVKQPNKYLRPARLATAKSVAAPAATTGA